MVIEMIKQLMAASKFSPLNSFLIASVIAFITYKVCYKIPTKKSPGPKISFYDPPGRVMSFVLLLIENSDPYA